MLEIKSVKRGSPFFRAGIKKGEFIAEFDGHPYVDQLDVLYYASLSSFEVTVFSKKGVERHVEICKNEDEDLGITYPDAEFDLRLCKNHCLFCFVEQCPKGMRSSMYVKDDDYRLSFTCGSYVTLSNVSEADIERIIRLKLSPLYISVHCFDPAIKSKLCGNPRSAMLFDVLKRLAAAGITLHTQIVMVEGINSGIVLQQTVNELYKLYPAVQSVAIVPVGLTSFRKGLTDLKTVSPECAAATIQFACDFASKVKSNGTGFVWCSDEMYILAKMPLPNYGYYEAFPQIENGVGEVTSFFREAAEELATGQKLFGNYVCVTGEAFAPLLKEFTDSLQHNNQLCLEVKAIRNDWFGHTVTVAGLLTATDIINQIKGTVNGKTVILPSTVLKEFENVFLDGITLQQFKTTLQCNVKLSCGGGSFIRILEGTE